MLFRSETKWEDATEPTHEEEAEWIHKISSYDDPERSWFEEMEQDPPEEEPQFFTLDPGDKTKERVKELVEEKLNESVLEGRLKEQLREVVRSRVDAFLTKGDPIQRIVDHYHEIETIGTPFKEKHFRVSPEQEKILEEEINLMLSMGVIEHCKSEWASRLLMVRKPDMSWRPCVD